MILATQNKKDFHKTQRKVILPKEFLTSMNRDESGKMAIWQKKSLCHFRTFVPMNL